MELFDERDRASVLEDLHCADEEVRRLAVERIDALAEHEVLPQLVERLGDSDWRVRKAAVARIVARRDPAAASEALIAALADGENPGRRNAAVEALVELGGPVVPALVEACRFVDADVRKFAVDALAGIGDEGSVAALVGVLGDSDANVSAAAADALGAIGGERAASVLRETALDSGADALVRFSALHALESLEVPMRAVELAPMLGDGVLGPAAYALLGRCEDDPGALEALEKGLASGLCAAREASMRGVLRLAGRLDGDAFDELVERVRETARTNADLVGNAIDRLGETDLTMQLVLVQFLGLVATSEAVLPILESGRDEALAPVARETLGAMGDVAAEAIDARWASLEAEARRRACAVLGGAGDERAVARLVAALEDSEPAVREAAAQALAERRADVALLPLVLCLERAAADEELEGGAERIAITAALVALAGPDADGASPPIAAAAIERLRERLPGASDPVRLAIARVLGAVARQQDAALIALLLKDPSADVRGAAVEAIARIEPAGAPEPLHLAIADESPEVRVAAARALGDSSSEAVYEDLCRLALDEDTRVRAMAVRSIGRGFAADAHPDLRASALAMLHRACDDEAPVALAVVESAIEVGGDAASYVKPLLVRREPELVREAVRCIGLHGQEEELESLLPLVAHSDWSVRAEAIEILAERRFRRALPNILRRLETEQDDFVRNVTLAALDRLEG